MDQFCLWSRDFSPSPSVGPEPPPHFLSDLPSPALITAATVAALQRFLAGSTVSLP